MKTYLPQIERRIIVRPNTTYGILSFDLDNAYPQRMLELVGQSPTAKDCWNKRAKFIGGNGFEDESIGETVINGRGLTLNRLRIAIATDKALFRGFGIHVNYNASFRVASVNYVAFEDIRMGNTDTEKYDGKFILYSDWGRKTWKNITTSKLTILNPYNPDPEAIKAQIVEAGGWENYKGQLYYFNPAIDDYPLIEADSVWEDFETEAGIKVFNNRQVTTGFLPAAMLFMQSRAEGEAEMNPNASENRAQQTQLEKNLGAFQGVKNSQQIIVIEYEDENAKPDLQQYNIQNNDKLFEVTEKSVESRIIKGFSVPRALVTSETKGSGLSDSGVDKKEAIREFNDNTAPDRLEISNTLKRIFSNFVTPINMDNWTISGIPTDVADDVIGKVAGANINALIAMQIPKENKTSILIAAYGFSPDEADSMVPNDKEIPQTTNPSE